MTAPYLCQAAVLVFGAYRILRLLGWDDWPPILRARQWVTGEYWVATIPPETVARIGYQMMDEEDGIERDPPPLPGKTPESEASDVRPAYRRPVLAHMIHCPFCLGAWVSLAVYVAWLAAPRPTLYVLAPFALSGVIGLIAKQLDP